MIICTSISSIAGSDYGEVLQFVMFHIGGGVGVRQCIQIPITDDQNFENNEYFSLSLFIPDVAVVAVNGRDSAIITIVDDEEGWSGTV